MSPDLATKQLVDKSCMEESIKASHYQKAHLFLSATSKGGSYYPWLMLQELGQQLPELNSEATAA